MKSRLVSRLLKFHSVNQDWHQDFQNTSPLIKTLIKTGIKTLTTPVPQLTLESRHLKMINTKHKIE